MAQANQNIKNISTNIDAKKKEYIDSEVTKGKPINNSRENKANITKELKNPDNVQKTVYTSDTNQESTDIKVTINNSLYNRGKNKTNFTEEWKTADNIAKTVDTRNMDKKFTDTKVTIHKSVHKRRKVKTGVTKEAANTVNMGEALETPSRNKIATDIKVDKSINKQRKSKMNVTAELENAANMEETTGIPKVTDPVNRIYRSVHHTRKPRSWYPKESNYANNWGLLGVPVYTRSFSLVRRNVNAYLPIYRESFQKPKISNACLNDFVSPLKKPNRTGKATSAKNNINMSCGCVAASAGFQPCDLCRISTATNSNADNSNKKKNLPPPTHDQWLSLITLDGKFRDKYYEEEIRKYVPDAKIVLATHDFREFQDDLLYNFNVPYILEMYDFPAAVVTKDVKRLFGKYTSKGLRIKWVDDTHLLLVFSSPDHAAQVLQESDSPPSLLKASFGQYKLRPLFEADLYSKKIARYHHLVELKPEFIPYL